LFIIQAILQARTEYVVYFLLSAWLESLGRKRYARSIPLEARQLPVHGIDDLSRRLTVVRERLECDRYGNDAEVRALTHAAAALSVACEKLRELVPVKSAVRLRRLFADRGFRGLHLPLYRGRALRGGRRG
jgi:hypothetical protein